MRQGVRHCDRCFHAGISRMSAMTGAGAPTVRMNVLTASPRRPSSTITRTRSGRWRSLAGRVPSTMNGASYTASRSIATPSLAASSASASGRHAADVCGPSGHVDHRSEVFDLPLDGVRRGARTALATTPSVAYTVNEPELLRQAARGTHRPVAQRAVDEDERGPLPVTS